MLFRSKQSVFSEFFSLKQLNVRFLQETHSSEDGAADWGLWWKGDYFLSHGSNVSAGVAILFSQSLKVTGLSKSEIEAGRLLMIRAKIEDHIFVFINVYAPNRGPDRVEFFTRLKHILQSLSSGDISVMGGDWNCTLDFTKDRNGEEPHLQSASALASVISTFTLTDVWRKNILRSNSTLG